MTIHYALRDFLRKKYLECSNIDKLIALIKTMNVQANWWGMDLKKIVINKIVMNWKKWNKFNLKLHMDGNALIITVAMCFLGNLRGCSLVEYIELELVTSCAPLRCYRPWLGGRQYYVDIFLLTLLESCVSTNHFTASNKSTQVI